MGVVRALRGGLRNAWSVASGPNLGAGIPQCCFSGGPFDEVWGSPLGAAVSGFFCFMFMTASIYVLLLRLQYVCFLRWPVRRAAAMLPFSISHLIDAMCPKASFFRSFNI